MKNPDNHTELKETMKARLKEFFGREWATKVAEKGGFTAVWVRKCFKAEGFRDEVFKAAKELLEETIEERENTLNNIQ